LRRSRHRDRRHQINCGWSTPGSNAIPTSKTKPISLDRIERILEPAKRLRLIEFASQVGTKQAWDSFLAPRYGILRGSPSRPARQTQRRHASSGEAHGAARIDAPPPPPPSSTAAGASARAQAAVTAMTSVTPSPEAAKAPTDSSETAKADAR
jgi:hypothetical protein